MSFAILKRPSLLLQVAAIEAMTTVIDSQLVPGTDVVDLLLPSVLANINVVGTPDEVCCVALCSSWQHSPLYPACQGLMLYMLLQCPVSFLCAGHQCMHLARNYNRLACAFNTVTHLLCAGCQRMAEVLPCPSALAGQSADQGQDLAGSSSKRGKR